MTLTLHALSRCTIQAISGGHRRALRRIPSPVAPASTAPLLITISRQRGVATRRSAAATGLVVRSAAVESSVDGKPTSTDGSLTQDYGDLCSRLKTIAHLEGVSGLLGWDELVMLPSGAAACRSSQKEALAGVIYEKKTEPEIGRLLEKLLPKMEAMDPNSAAVVREAERDYKRLTAISKGMAEKMARLESEGYQSWVAARKSGDFSKFAPVLQEWVKLTRERCAIIDPSRPAYDVCLDDFEKGMTSDRLDTIFSTLRASLVPLIKDLRSSGCAPDRSFLEGEWDVETQAKLCEEVAMDLGFNTEMGRLDVSVHPFTGGSHPTDVRMTTRFKATDVTEGLTGTIHETGHALYEQGRSLEYDNLPVNRAAGMGIHESQSLLWERMVALSLPFSNYLHPKLAAAFPEMLKGRTPTDLYAAMNVMQERSMIRVESDELTYPLHIILRYELERGLIDGSIQVKDLPELWNAKMTEYLGCTPTSDAEGVLQDVHWSAGAFGYFPTYSLGAMYGCQIYKEAHRCLPSLDSDIAAGNFAPLKEWLNKNIHEVGSLHATGDELMRAVTGSKLDPQVYLNHLTSKYSVAYKLCTAEEDDSGSVFHFS
uniref:Carboxypeptidase n=1 Tax=Tetraselmis chuii TaxID=63592 RepID=A0A7S1WYZ1_9CHLO|mmetsp:Transcript_11116/g.20034  ORF Transcript_11116/g.20034 Transcript_11116/m.20034 type:complete len:598 (+) Transcript_11116:283-2076(+)